MLGTTWLGLSYLEICSRAKKERTSEEPGSNSGVDSKMSKILGWKQELYHKHDFVECSEIRLLSENEDVIQTYNMITHKISHLFSRGPFNLVVVGISSDQEIRVISVIFVVILTKVIAEIYCCCQHCIILIILKLWRFVFLLVTTRVLAINGWKFMFNDIRTNTGLDIINVMIKNVRISFFRFQSYFRQLKRVRWMSGTKWIINKRNDSDVLSLVKSSQQFFFSNGIICIFHLRLKEIFWKKVSVSS